MEKDTTRLHSLDGLRGLSMILVFLNHASPAYLIAALPFLDKIGLFSSGVTGVSFFFILSGFLMAFLYPLPQDRFGFLQKRYSRIFPVFITMCSAMLVYSIYPTIPWFLQLPFIFTLAILVHLVWVYGIKRIQSAVFSKIIFFSFLFIQIFVGAFYVLWIMRQPPSVFQSYPNFIQHITLGLINATLTFPLGNYFPMLDGVYWSLAAEILFYILYPSLIAPIVLLLVPKRRSLKIFFLITLLPFLGGVDIISRYIFNLSALQLNLFYYFAVGILLGHLYRKKPHVFSIFSKIFRGVFMYIPIFLFFLALLGEHLLNSFLPSSFGPWERLLFAIPLGFLVAIALNKQTSLYKFFSSKILVFIGTISYSMYLSHSAIIHMAEVFHKSGSLNEDIVTIFLTFFLTIGVSIILYLLLERPYFQKKPNAKIQKSLNPISVKFIWEGKIIYGLITAVYLIIIFFAFQSKFNFFSLVAPISTSPLSKSHLDKSISLQNIATVSATITAKENNLGIILLSIKHVNPTHQLENSPSLIFSIAETGQTHPIASLPYVLDEFRGSDFPFGFPNISDSKNKSYTISFNLVPPSQKNYVIIDTNSLKAVYQTDKISLIKSPTKFAYFVINKFQGVLENPLSQITLILLLPFLLAGLLLGLTPNKITERHVKFLEKNI